uniref:Uncharacterized protein n=1 Tax=Anguilla anguilla TaxID=7936 RepID=A0A0E9S5C8_ANGAN
MSQHTGLTPALLQTVNYDSHRELGTIFICL